MIDLLTEKFDTITTYDRARGERLFSYSMTHDSQESISNYIRELADDDSGFENMVFELGVLGLTLWMKLLRGAVYKEDL